MTHTVGISDTHTAITSNKHTERTHIKTFKLIHSHISTLTQRNRDKTRHNLRDRNTEIELQSHRHTQSGTHPDTQTPIPL